MTSEVDKKLYKIGDVAAILGVQPSAIRFWEKSFPQLAPRRSVSGATRKYTPQDIEKLRLIRYLVRDRGLRIEAAREQLASNPADLSRQAEAVDRLHKIRRQLTDWLEALKRLPGSADPCH